jgi:hypothetical protein
MLPPLGATEHGQHYQQNAPAFLRHHLATMPDALAKIGPRKVLVQFSGKQFAVNLGQFINLLACLR